MADYLFDFLILGAMKSGTTGLYNMLRQHPEINMCLVKEPNFFNIADDTKGNWELGPSWYRNLFQAKRGLKGEATTSYTRFPNVIGTPRRIYEANPYARFVYVVRNPVNRSISHYLQRVIAGAEKRLIHDALKSSTSDYLLTSMYYLQVRQYLEYFSTEQVCIVVAEAMWKNPPVALDRISRFLGIESMEPSDHRALKANVTRVKAQMYLSNDNLTEAQNRIKFAVDKGIIKNGDGARDFAEALGFGEEDQARLARRLEEDVYCLRRLSNETIPEWEDSFGPFQKRHN